MLGEFLGECSRLWKLVKVKNLAQNWPKIGLSDSSSKGKFCFFVVFLSNQASLVAFISTKIYPKIQVKRVRLPKFHRHIFLVASITSPSPNCYTHWKETQVKHSWFPRVLDLWLVLKIINVIPKLQVALKYPRNWICG